jgi:hypothetical protein
LKKKVCVGKRKYITRAHAFFAVVLLGFTPPPPRLSLQLHLQAVYTDRRKTERAVRNALWELGGGGGSIKSKTSVGLSQLVTVMVDALTHLYTYRNFLKMRSSEWMRSSIVDEI